MSSHAYCQALKSRETALNNRQLATPPWDTFETARRVTGTPAQDVSAQQRNIHFQMDINKCSDYGIRPSAPSTAP